MDRRTRLCTPSLQVARWPAALGCLGSAYYQLAEIQRLHGEFAEAEGSYRKPAWRDVTRNPGCRCSASRRGESTSLFRRSAARSTRQRARSLASLLLPAYVEVMLEADDVRAARAAADELCAIAAQFDAPYLNALAAQASGAVLLAEGDPRTALTKLRAAHRSWRELEAPYQAARVRLLIGIACRDSATVPAPSSSSRRPAACSRSWARSRSRAAGSAPAPRGRKATEPARERGAHARCHGEDQPRDRGRALHQREDSRATRQQYLQEVAPLVSDRGHRIRLQARPCPVAADYTELPISRHRKIGCFARSRSAARPLRSGARSTRQGGNDDHEPGRSTTSEAHAALREAWDAIAEGYDLYVAPQEVDLAKEALRLVGLEPGERFLDVAAGTGGLSLSAARLAARVLATDWSPAMIERFQARVREEHLRDAEGRVMDCHALDLPHDSFDVTGSQFGVMLVPDQERALREMVRVTKPGGRVLVIAYGFPDGARVPPTFRQRAEGRRARVPRHSRRSAATRVPGIRPCRLAPAPDRRGLEGRSDRDGGPSGPRSARARRCGIGCCTATRCQRC